MGVVDKRLADLERYYDTAPRAGADPEEVGPFTLFRSRHPWPYYARPRLGLDRAVTAEDVSALIRRLDELGLPHAIEWVHETTPSLLPTATAAGLSPEALPLQVLDALVPVAAPGTVDVRVLHPDDAEVPAAVAVANIAFAAPGTAFGSAGAGERDARIEQPDNTAAATAVRGLLRDRLSTMGVVVDLAGALGGGVVASGAANRRGDTSEVVGVATLPAARRHGLAAALTTLLVRTVQDAGVRTVFLSAGSADVARVYRRLGFVDVGTAYVVE